MPVGLEVLAADGTVRASYTTPASRVIDVFEVAAGSSGSKSYGLVNNNIHAVVSGISGDSIPPRVTTSGKTISWVSTALPAGQGAGRIVVFSR